MDEFFSNPTNFSIRLSVAQPLRKRKERGGTSGISRVTLTERPGALLFWSAVIPLIKASLFSTQRIPKQLEGGWERADFRISDISNSLEL